MGEILEKMCYRVLFRNSISVLSYIQAMGQLHVVVRCYRVDEVGYPGERMFSDPARLVVQETADQDIHEATTSSVEVSW